MPQTQSINSKRSIFLHAAMDGLYYLIFKTIFETKNNYPKAYTTALLYIEHGSPMKYIASLGYSN